MPCETDYIECDNKQLGMNQLLNLLLTTLASGDPAIRVCDASGGVPGAVTLPVGNFVFVNPLGNDGTGAREDFHLPFLTLNAAKTAAQAGDTIYVYGGTYNEANPLFKTGVKWHFVGQPILNLSASSVWWDNDVDEIIEITGDAVVNHIGTGQVIRIAGPNTVANINFKSVTSLGNAVILLHGGSGTINITDTLNCTLVNHSLRFDGNASYTVNINTILNSATIGVASCVYVKNSALIYTGHSVVNSKLIQCDGIFSAVRMDYQNMPGTLIVNISEKIIRTDNTTIDPQSNNTVMCLGANLIINGDIDGQFGHAIQMSGNQPKTFIHNGNAINNGDLPLVGHGQGGIAFWDDNNGVLTMNGNYTSSNAETVTHGGAASKLIVDGAIYNQQGVGVTKGISLTATAGPVLLNTVKIIMDLAAATPNGIGAAAARDVKIIHGVSSNAGPDGNITNLITGTTYVVDADVE